LSGSGVPGDGGIGPVSRHSGGLSSTSMCVRMGVLIQSKFSLANTGNDRPFRDGLYHQDTSPISSAGYPASRNCAMIVSTWAGSRVSRTTSISAILTGTSWKSRW
jgi:hypothetical protein